MAFSARLDSRARGRVFALYRLAQTRERASALLDALRSVTVAPYAGSGCLSSRVLVDADDPGALALIEEWQTSGHLETHLRSRLFRRALSVLELSLAAPDVVYVVDGEVRGIEWLAEVLGRGAEAGEPGHGSDR
jgi:quinol monooxygenase YgiN